MQALLEQMDRPQTRLLTGLALMAFFAWLFLAVAGEVVEGDTRTLDAQILLRLRQPGDPAQPIGPAWLAEAARDVTALGGPAILWSVTMAAAGYLLVAGKPSWALYLLLAIGSGALLEQLLKLGFARPRPDLVAHLVKVDSPSFPSGHAMLGAIVYLTLGALLGQAEARRRVELYIIAVATVMTLAVGATRLYLGVHWPSDVLAGWSAGAAWALAWWLGAHVLRRYARVPWASQPVIGTTMPAAGPEVAIEATGTALEAEVRR